MILYAHLLRGMSFRERKMKDLIFLAQQTVEIQENDTSAYI